MNLINYKNLLIVLLTIFTTSISHSFEPILHIDNKKQTTKSGIDYHMHYASYGLITKELSHDVKYQADIVLYTLDEWKTIYGFHFKMHKKAMMTKEDADGEISKSSETVALQNKNPVRIGRDAADMLFDKEELFENYFGLFDMKDNKWKFVKLAENKNKKKGIKYLNEDKNNFREWI